ncbi:hypothetical protein B0H67DRAFT_551313 [Lasiosphaeris hirsuta]|uniref:F-box domain-containing protein n=1 Tax=Lasiosphaeris hirsuta TaxID=260670 RepID=A0AA40E813_9PEZI|nr:hypothetical protein B0H67DRAFT_551313 [Lasiosphaeris hirsuta]
MSTIPVSMMDPSAPPSPRRLLLCDLPDNVLLAIMSQADQVSLFCLRRVSRIFLRLFKDRRFRHVHIDPFTSRWPFHLSPAWKLEKVAADIKPILRPLLQKDLFCQKCRNTGPEAELRLRTKLLYCSGCRTKHSADKHPLRIYLGYDCEKKACRYIHISNTSPEPDPSTGPEPIICVDWLTHINVRGLGLTAAVDGLDVLRHIEWVRQNGGAEIFPPMQQGKYPAELQFFDPKFCTCLRFDAPPDGWELRNEQTECPLHGVRKENSTSLLPGLLWNIQP